MARNPTGKEALEQARRDLATASTIHELRVAQAVVLPLDLGISLTRTAELIGMTPGWVARARIRYIDLHAKGKNPETRGGRRNNLLSLDEERQIVQAVLKQRAYSWNTRIQDLKILLEKSIGRRVALSTVYNIRNRVREGQSAELRWVTYF